MTPIEDLLQQCTVKITVPGGWGTGFFVAPGLILTCAHVVRKAVDSQVSVSCSARESPLLATVKAQVDDRKTLDLALVELAEPLPEHPCVLLDEEPVAIGQALYSYGYLESYTNAAPVRPVNEGLTGDAPPLLKLQGAQIEHGISGAALLNLKTGKICGMVKETRAAGFDLGGGAIPTRVILQQFPELRELQRVFHEGDWRWSDLAAIRQDPTPVQSRIWMIPANRNPFFTGRETLLTEIRDCLIAGQPTAFCGLGGIGKTQTVIEYSYRYRERYEAVLWVRAELVGEFVSGLVEVAKALKLPIAQERDETLIISVVKLWLKQHQNWLLVLDNADDLTVVQPFLRGIDTGHILLTSRAQATGAIKRIEIQQMSLEEGALFLLRRAKVIGEQAEWNAASADAQALAVKIASQMDGLPLALDQAGAFIEETFTSLEDYLAFYEAEGVKLLSERGELADDHPSVTVTFSLAFEKVIERNLAAADLIRVCAFLSPDDIPEELFRQAAVELGDYLKTLSKQPLELAKVIAEASRFSLLYRNPTNRTFSIHRLVQEVLRARMSPDECCLWTERIIRALNQIFPEPDYPNWSLCDRLLPHTRAATALIAPYQLHFEAASNLLDKTARYLRERGQYAEAEPLLQKSLDVRRQLFGETHPDIATSLNNLASLYKDQRQYSEAELLYRQSLEMRQLLLKEENLDVATSRNDLAIVLKARDQFKEAESLHLKALETRRKLLGSDHLDIAESLNNLGVLYLAQGRYEETESLLKDALSCRRKLLGEEHPRTISSLNNLATCYRNQKQYEQAEGIYAQVVSLATRVFGEVSHQRAIYLNNLASIYADQGKLPLAKTSLEEALIIQRQLLGEKHPNIAFILTNLGSLNEDWGNLDEAETFYLQALEVKIQALGKKDSSVARSLNNLAKFYVGRGRYDDARRLYLEALEILQLSLGEKHPDFKKIENNLEELLKMMDQ